MVDLIDDLKRKYTDKYVVVDAQRPELARFRDTYGTVKTVNMSGRALVEFADYHLNIGWYDIDPSYLKLIDAPLPPKPKEAAPAKAPAAKKAPGEAASAAGSAGAKPSTADILAKLRGGGAAKPAGEPASAGGSSPAKPAAPKPAAAPVAPAKIDRSKMSVADMLAAARAGGAKGPAPVEEPPGEPASAGGEPTKEAPVAVPAKAKPAASGPFDKSKMSIDDMCTWCREHDAK